MQLAGFLHFDTMLGKLPLILRGREGCLHGGDGSDDGGDDCEEDSS